MIKLDYHFLQKLNITFFCIILLSFITIHMCRANAYPPEISAKHAIVIEAMTGRAIYEKNADDRAYPASLTKMLTCIIALEDGSLEDIYTVSSNAAVAEDPYLQLKAGEQLTLRDLILGLMMVSDNSAAVAIAEGIDGSTSNFSITMNNKAKEIGLNSSHFVTPNGLPAPDHYSTARDMAYIAAYAWQNSIFRDIVGQQNERITWQLPDGKSVLVENSNKLLGRMDGANGIKTGWTSAAGGCLAASAKRDGVQLIAVVMDSNDVDTRFNDAEKILEYGFTQVQQVKGVDKSRSEKKIFVAKGDNYRLTAHPAEDIYFPLLIGESLNDYTMKFDVPFAVSAPIRKGQKVGNLIIYCKGQELRQVPLLADNGVNKGFNILSMIIDVINQIVTKLKG